ncbi:acetyl-CoA synthetase-like protein [Phlebopus sp. FC_14]|nr:acetyl-CoA synthetase-like protein [Phlebopus sp. FC_14]
MATPVLPPMDYSLLFPDLINFHTSKNASFPIYVYSNDKSPGGISQITFLEFGRAANRVAHVLRPGRQGTEGQTVMLIATTDTLLYHAVVSGMNLAGFIPFPVSPRNSSAAVADMMRKTDCSRILTLHHVHQSLIDGVRREMLGIELYIEEIPTLAHAFPKLGCELESDTFEPYPVFSSRPNPDDTAVYLHSSGSTGFPKPIAITYAMQINWMCQARNLDYYKAPVLPRVGVMSLPPFHAYGMAHQLYIPLGRVGPAVIYPPRTTTDPHAAPVIPTGDNVLNCLKRTKCGLLMAVPAFIEQWSTSSDALEELRKLDFLIYGGGFLPMKIGHAMWSAGVSIAAGYGGTEFGNITTIPDKQDIIDGDWEWMRIQPGIKIRWEPQGDGTYECQVLMTENYHTAVRNLPDVSGYATSDLFVKHPRKDMWKIVGRKDDVIVLASGEKTVPTPIESIIKSGPIIQEAVLFGRGRNQVGVLVEPRVGYEVDPKDPNAVAEFRNKIWPLIQEANATSPAFSRVFRDMVLITSRDKPMARSAKGTVQTKATLKAYESEIDALYNLVEGTSQSPFSSGGPSAWTTEALESWLTKHASAISSGRHIDSNIDVFSQGFDSLSATYLRNQIIAALRNSSEPSAQKAVSLVHPNIVFERPTIKLLSCRVAGLVMRDAASWDASTSHAEQHKVAISAMIEKYSVGLDAPIHSIFGDDADRTSPAVVLLTGSTGGLGTHLLARLLESPAVERVYALNRPSFSSVEERQRSAFIDKGQCIELLNSTKLVYVEADTAQQKCGLSDLRYDEGRNIQICGSVTVIIHNAWRLDFNLSLSSFEPNVRATRNLVDLARDSPHRSTIRFLFTSSVSSSSSWDIARGPLPEEVQSDPMIAVGIGYGESKYVAERIIANSGVHATSIRLGQIAGAMNGSWATTDWVPIMIKSSIALGALPDAYGVVSWLRPCEVAFSILEIAIAKEAMPPVLNIVNPRATPWIDIISSVHEYVVQNTGLKHDELPIIPFSDWFARLEAKADGMSSNDLQSIPAVKLLEFFRLMSLGDQISRHSRPATTEAGGIINMSTSKSQLASKTVAEMQPIGEADVEEWVWHWSSKGFL